MTKQGKASRRPRHAERKRSIGKKRFFGKPQNDIGEKALNDK